MDFEKLRTHRNMTNAFANLIHLEIEEISLGYARASVPISEDFLNPVGSVHGGCQFTLADVTGGAAAVSHGFQVVTLDSSFHYLNAGLDTAKITAEARELKSGKRTLVYDVSIKDQDGKLLSEGIFTYMSLGVKIEL